MRILIFTHAISRHKDDYPQFINELALAYQQAGHEVMLLTASHVTIKKELLNEQIDIELYRYAPRKLEIMGYGESLRSDLNMTAAALFLSPLMFIFGWIALRRVVKKYRPDFIHSHWAIPNGVIASLACLPGGMKHMISCPGSDVTALGSNIIFKLLGRYACNQADMLTTNSHDLHDELRRCGVSNKNFAYVVYGTTSIKEKINKDFISDFKNRNNIEEDEVILFAVGRLVPKKGFRYLIEALKFLETEKKYRLILVGDGLDRALLLQLSKDYEVEKNIVFTGNIAYTELPQFYLMSDIFIMPAVRNPFDGLNVVVCEAMKYGLPIIATNVGGNELVIEHGVNGLLCDEKNPRQLASCIDTCMASEELMQEYGANSELSFAGKASWGKIAKEYIDLVVSSGKQ